ncbi:VanZ family protein [Hymenobacter ruricola]|uniref:VanZ family protein n=1 Tax=Hymenobacter ruricola TaxID=2791023 RepID=A0ABS0I973_9BACT|nr:VanZ family protein [Hymenobacter ruricola]MBF9223228.1 VanZ family protein [Hymenobacter ruricola]
MPNVPPHPSPRPYAGLPLAWAAVVLVLTLTPSDEMPRTPVWELLSFDTAAHAGVFFVLAGLSWFSLRRQRHWPRLARHAGAAVLVASVLFGALIEELQMTMRLGRHGEWSDLLSDGLGAALAVGLATAWAGRLSKKARAVASIFRAGLLLAGLGSGPVQAQDVARARRTIEKLAAPEMHGRGYVQQGEHKAAAYLRGRFKELKLEPLAPDYTQPFTLDVNTFPGKLQANCLLNGQGGMNCIGLGWQPGAALIAAPNSGSGQAHGRIQVLDSTVLADTLKWAWWRQQPLHGRVLLMRKGVADHLDKLPAAVRQQLDSAAAWVTVVPKLTASLAAEQAPQPRVEVLASKMPRWQVPDRYNTPTSITPENGNVEAYIQVDAQLRRNYQTQNLAAVVRGTAQPDSFLVVSAHYDHLGMMGKDAYFPGANDNASGVALLLELAAHYARPENRPACSVVFLLFGAEEAGLVGSSYFVAHPLVPLQRIKFLVNLDLLGTGEQGATVVNGRVFEAPYQRLVALNNAHHYLPQLAPRGRAANSDHFPFSEAGVPAFFLCTRGGSTAYHDVNDRPAALSLAGFAGAFGLVRDFLNEEGATIGAKKNR